MVAENRNRIISYYTWVGCYIYTNTRDKEEQQGARISLFFQVNMPQLYIWGHRRKAKFGDRHKGREVESPPYDENSELKLRVTA